MCAGRAVMLVQAWVAGGWVGGWERHAQAAQAAELVLPRCPSRRTLISLGPAVMGLKQTSTSVSAPATSTNESGDTCGCAWECSGLWEARKAGLSSKGPSHFGKGVRGVGWGGGARGTP